MSVFLCRRSHLEKDSLTLAEIHRIQIGVVDRSIGREYHLDVESELEQQFSLRPFMTYHKSLWEPPIPGV